MIKAFIDWYLSVLVDGGYSVIALLMAVESSIVPVSYTHLTLPTNREV